MPPLNDLHAFALPPLNILIVKLSSLGDVIHAMAAVHDLVRSVPDAQVDWVVEDAFAPLVRRCAGVRRVIPVALRRWRKAPFSAASRQGWARFRAELALAAYDAVIDLQGLSKSALVAWLARLTPGGQRIAIGNRTDGSSYETPTRWVAHRAIALPPHSHAVTRSRLLCAVALGYALPTEVGFGLVADARAVNPAWRLRAQRAGWRGLVALLPGSSRADKLWPLTHWRALVQTLGAHGWGVVLAHGSDAEQSLAQAIAADHDHAVVWPRLALDALADALSTCAGAIGVDSGPAHLAVALGLAHVQIYLHDTAWRTGPLAPPAPHTGHRAAPRAEPAAAAHQPRAAEQTGAAVSAAPGAEWVAPVWHADGGLPAPQGQRMLSVVGAPPTVAAIWAAWQAVSAAACVPTCADAAP